MSGRRNTTPAPISIIMNNQHLSHIGTDGMMIGTLISGSNSGGMLLAAEWSPDNDRMTLTSLDLEHARVYGLGTLSCFAAEVKIPEP